VCRVDKFTTFKCRLSSYLQASNSRKTLGPVKASTGIALHFIIYIRSYRVILEGLGDYKIGGQIIHTVKYADDLVLLAKEEKVLQNMIDKLIEIGRCYGMEINVEKNKSNENFKTTIPSKNYDRPKTTTECGIF